MKHVQTISRSRPAPGFNLGPFLPLGIVEFLQYLGMRILYILKGMQPN